MAPGPRLVVGLAQLNGFQEITQLGHSVIRKPNQKMLYLSLPKFSVYLMNSVTKLSYETWRSYISLLIRSETLRNCLRPIS